MFLQYLAFTLILILYTSIGYLVNYKKEIWIFTMQNFLILEDGGKNFIIYYYWNWIFSSTEFIWLLWRFTKNTKYCLRFCTTKIHFRDLDLKKQAKFFFGWPVLATQLKYNHTIIIFWNLFILNVHFSIRGILRKSEK